MAETTNKKTLTLYVYYKIPRDKSLSYLLAVKNVSHTIKKHYPSLVINHQKRPDSDAENKELWMETYHNISASHFEKFKTDLILLAQQNGLPVERKYEVFVSLPIIEVE